MLQINNYKKEWLKHFRRMDGYRLQHATVKYQPAGQRNTLRPRNETSGLQYWNRNGPRSLSPWKRDDDDDNDDDGGDDMMTAVMVVIYSTKILV